MVALDTQEGLMKRGKRKPYELMKGAARMQGEEIWAAFERGCFSYQFGKPNGTYSRIMLCDNPAELEWLIGQSATGPDKVYVRPALSLTKAHAA
jgi:hypothetical protein